MPSTRALNQSDVDRVGRAAFWRGKPLSVNPFIGDDAERWRKAWRSALEDYRVRSGRRVVSVPELARYRPADIKAPPVQIYQQRAGGRRTAREMRETDGTTLLPASPRAMPWEPL